ncbi:MAG: hypothetical protein J7L25_01460, partial [Deltaproteobacteria bacterium]|nr:hypothetical protein [Candidatus Tharpella aukensis]
MKSTGMIKVRLHGNKNYHLLSYPCLVLLLLVILSAIFVSPLWALNEGANIPISVANGGAEPPVLLSDDQQNPTIIALPDKNKWFVVWEDWRNWRTTGVDIYGRFINSDGTLCGNEIAISTASGNQMVPTLAYRDTPGGTDNIMIAWQDNRGTGYSGYIYFNILNISSLAASCSSGAILGSERSVGYRSIGGDRLRSRKLPKIAYDKAKDQFWMVWVESRDQVQRLVEYPFGNFGSPKWNFADSNYLSFTTVSAAGSSAAIPEILRNTDGSLLRTVRLISSTSDFDEKEGTVEYIYEYFTGINNITVACDDISSDVLIAWQGIRGQATLTCKWEDKDEEEIVVGEDCNWEDCTEPCGGAGEPNCSAVCDRVCTPIMGPNPDYGVPTRGDTYSSKLKLESGFDDGNVHIYSIFEQ